MVTPAKVYRRSELEDSDCLYRYRTIWLRGETDESDASLRGQAFHHCAQRYIERLVAKQLDTDAEEAQAAFVQGIAEHQTPQHLIPELRELFLDLWAPHFRLDLERFMTAEERVVGGNQAFTPDLVYASADELEIVDWKSFWSMLTEEEIRNTYQCRYYIWQAMQRWPNFLRYRFTMAFVRFNKAVSVVFAPSDVDPIVVEVEADIARIEHAAETGEYPATSCLACRYCRIRCPIVEQELVLPPRIEAEQAPKVANWLRPSKQKIADVQKTLKACVSANGPVTVNGVTWANWPVVERSYPASAVIRALREAELFGALDEEGLTFSHSALKKLFKRFPAIEEGLKDKASFKHKTRFDGKAAGDDEAAD